MYVALFEGKLFSFTSCGHPTGTPLKMLLGSIPAISTRSALLAMPAGHVPSLDVDSLTTVLLAEEELRRALKSEAAEALDDFFAVFPLLFVGGELLRPTTHVPHHCRPHRVANPWGR